MSNQYERVINVLGENGLAVLRKSSVLVAGLGGVGSYSVEALARSGVGHLLIADCDSVEPTNLNRQIEALHSTLGSWKTEAEKERIHDIDPDTAVTAFDLRISEETAEQLFEEKPDFVIDAIDDLNAKLVLWKICRQRNIPFVASLGMARRLDPTAVQITALNRTTKDPMARKLRHMAKQAGLDLNIPVVWSSEDPLPMNEKGILGSMIFVPAAAGLACAQVCVKRLLEEQEGIL